MNATDPIIVRSEFSYRGVLLVTYGGDLLKTQERASEGVIEDLLLGREAKDQVAHWYEAQLMHYGLQRSKDKNTAKVRLQQALYQGRLKYQPPHLADMEEQMKREYVAALHRAKRNGRDQSTKRGRDEDDSTDNSRRTRVSVTMDGISNIDRSEASKSDFVRSPKAIPAKAPMSTPQTRKAEQTSWAHEAKRTTAGKKSAATEPLRDPRDHTDNVFQSSSSYYAPDSSPQPAKPPRTKQTARKSAPMLGTRHESEAPKQSETRVKKEPQIKKESGTQNRAPVKDEPYDDGYDQPDFEQCHRAQDHYGHNEYHQDDYVQVEYDKNDYGQDNAMYTNPNISQGPVNLSVVYNIDCPQLAEQAPEDVDNFRFFLCVDNENGLIWGGFELAWKSGVLKIDNIAFNQDLSFGWRARDFQGGDPLRFGRGCFGEIAFDGNDQLQGTFHNLFPESVAFAGVRQPGPSWCGRCAYDFQQEWDFYPTEAYGRRCTTRRWSTF